MANNSEKTNARDTVKAARIINTAKITGVSPRHVRRVLEAESENEHVLSAYMFLTEGENKLIEAVKKLVPLS